MPTMLNYVINNFYHDLKYKSLTEKHQTFFDELVCRTAKLAAKWQAYGFCHGVLNTDNMSILGITIDYGPFAFMEHYNPKFICNYSDKEGRYRYEAQPEICLFNLQKLLESLDPFVKMEQKKLDTDYWTAYREEYNSLMSKKLGLKAHHTELVDSLF